MVRRSSSRNRSGRLASLASAGLEPNSDRAVASVSLTKERRGSSIFLGSSPKHIRNLPNGREQGSGRICRTKTKEDWHNCARKSIFEPAYRHKNVDRGITFVSVALMPREAGNLDAAVLRFVLSVEVNNH